VLRTILCRELGTLPESATYAARLRRNLLSLTEDVVTGSAPHPMPREAALKIAQTFVAVGAAAEIVALAVDRCAEPDDVS